MGPVTNGGKKKPSKKQVKPVKRPRPKYELVVLNGTGSGRYPAGAKVMIQATPPEGMTFRRWSPTEAGVVDDIDSATTVVTMPAKRLVVNVLGQPEQVPITQGDDRMEERTRRQDGWKTTAMILAVLLILIFVVGVAGLFRPTASAVPAPGLGQENQAYATPTPLATIEVPATLPTVELVVASPVPTAVEQSAEAGTAPTVDMFTYLPGGEGFGQAATDVVNPPGRSGCIRVWQATNLENLPWTFILCNFQTSDPAPKMQWPHPTQFTISGNGTVEFELWRDLHAVEQLTERGQYSGTDPYDVANVKDSSLGLGWFTQGFNGQVCVNDECRPLDGGGVFQLGFPRDMAGFYHVVITVNNGQVQFWQGEKLTTQDNWPLPE